LVTVHVVARATEPGETLSISVSCHSGKRDGPTYGCLDSKSVQCRLNPQWAMYRASLELSEGTREVEFMLATEGSTSTVDVQSIEWELSRSASMKASLR
jgi:hypothetical protein